jgi:hypothetical protein
VTFTQRLSGALKLSPGAFEDVELDTRSFAQSASVVVLSAAAMALGTHGRESPVTIAVAIGTGVFGWVLWSWIAFAVGTTLLRTSQTDANWGQLLRTTGFATAPGLIAVAGIFRPLAGIAVFTAAIWIVLALLVAAKQALDYSSTPRAVLVCLVAWSVNVIFVLLVLPTPR